MHVGSDAIHAKRIAPFSASQRASRFETLACGAATISDNRRGMLGALVGTTLPPVHHGVPALRPLWANEAIQRACDFAALFGWVERDQSRASPSSQALETEWRLVHELTSLYASLDHDDDTILYACSHAIRFAARDHVELFGLGKNPMRVCTAVDRLALPAYRQRALILITCRLVIEALLRIATRHGPARLVVLMAVESSETATLSVTQDLSGPYQVPSTQPSECTLDLAALLECDPKVEAQRHFITTTLHFPL